MRIRLKYGERMRKESKNIENSRKTKRRRKHTIELYDRRRSGWCFVRDASRVDTTMCGDSSDGSNSTTERAIDRVSDPVLTHAAAAIPEILEPCTAEDMTEKLRKTK